MVGLALAFEINCGSVSSDGSGTGGSGGGQSGGAGQTGKGGSGGGGNAGTHGGSGGQAGAGATSGSGGQGGDVAATGGAGGDHASGGSGGHASGGAGGHASGGGGGHATGGAAGGGAGNGGHAGGGGSATGGHGGGGQGGQSVDSGVSCAELANEYSAALPAAEACTAGAANQCQQLVSISLSVCTGCQHYVTNATTLNALRTQWTNQGCDQPTGTVICPLAAVLCINPGTAGACAGTDGSPNGICGLGITAAN